MARSYLLAFPFSHGRESTLKDAHELALGRKTPSVWKGTVESDENKHDLGAINTH